MVFPGCPETFEESEQSEEEQQGQQQPWQGQQGQQGRRQGQHGQQGQQQQQQESYEQIEQIDRHQRVRRVKEGDVIAIPAGVTTWSHNDGDQSLVFVSLIDINNELNQLDQIPRVQLLTNIFIAGYNTC